MAGHTWTHQESLVYANALKQRFQSDREEKGRAELEYENVKSPRRVVFRMEQAVGNKVLVAWECWNGDAREFTAQSVEDGADLARDWIAQRLNEPLLAYYEFLTD